MIFRPAPDWRRRHVFGAVCLRPPIAQHTIEEDKLLRRQAAKARTIVELGVAEGGSAVSMREAAPHGARLVLVDPYQRNRWGVSFARTVARRNVGRVRRGDVTWIEMTSAEAARGWSDSIDLLFVDADHSFERALDDWVRWSPHVAIGGVVAFHDARVFDGGWVTPETGSARVVADHVTNNESWTLVDEADSTVAYERIT